MKIFKVSTCTQRKVWPGKNGMTWYRTSLSEVMESPFNFNGEKKGGGLYIILILSPNFRGKISYPERFKN